MPRLIGYFNRIQANIQEPGTSGLRRNDKSEDGTFSSLVNRFQGTCDRQVILEFDCDTLICECLEDREYKLEIEIAVVNQGHCIPQ